MNHTISKAIPRPEHPTPQFERSTWMNLNGEWQFALDHSVSGKARKLYEADSLPDTITVPFCMESKLSGVGYTDFCDCVWYRREIDLPANWLENGKRVILHIGACDYITDAWVNGTPVGSHKGGYVSFSFDVTDSMVAGKNVITISAEDYLRSERQPAGKQSLKYESWGCFYTRTTGIWQTVWLENTPATHIKRAEFITNVADSSLTVKATLCGSATLTAEAFLDGRSVGKASLKGSDGINALTLPLSELRLWEIGKGGLYDLTLTYGEDTVKSYFGMRTLTLDDQALVINGKKVFQRLVLDQGYYPDGLYTAPTEQDLIDDITRSMACGFNGARLHQKVFEPRFLYHCDRLGYLAWDELGNWGLRAEDPNSWYCFIPEWVEIVQRDVNHPSIIGWCPFNETCARHGGINDPLIGYTAELTRTLDPTRPVIESSGWWHVMGAGDILDWHDYDQNPETFRQRYEDVANGIPIINKRYAPCPLLPRFISEYGGIKWDVSSGLGNAWGYGDAPKTEEEFLSRFKGLAEALLFNPFITGLCYTQLTDVEQECNGLYTYDRKPKFDSAFFYNVLTQKAAIEE